MKNFTDDLLPIYLAELRANMVRVDSNFSATPFEVKISNAEQLRVHTMLVGGGRDMEAGAVSVRLHHGGPQGAKLEEIFQLSSTERLGRISS